MYRRTSTLGPLTRLAAITVLAASSSTIGCSSTGNQAPFDVYTSPLLASEIQPNRPRARTFDPLRLGDHNVPDTVYASNDRGSRWDSREDRQLTEPASQGAPASKPAARKAQPRPAPKSPPTLSTTTKAAPRAPQASARTEPAPDAGSSFQPDRAAEYVWAVYGLNRAPLPDAARDHIPAIYKHCKADGKISHSTDALPGDLAFFHNTYDKNGDGRNNDWYTHVGMVQKVDDAGTVSILSYIDGKVSTFRLNLRNPDQTELDGETVNAQLRRPSADDAPFTQYHAGQLFAGFCRLLPDDKADLVVVDNWQPGMDLSR